MKNLIAVFTLLFSLQSFANVIEIDLGATDVEVGQTLTVTLNASGFDEFDQFNFDFLFDAALFEFVEFSEMSDLPNDGFEGIFEAGFGPGFAGFGWSSFFAPFFDGAFTISFDLLATAVGTDSFSLGNAVFETLANQFPEELEVNTAATAGAEVTAAQVPAPATLVILGVALAGLFGFRRKA